MKLPLTFKGILFLLLTFANAGIASFFAAVGAFEQCAFSAVTTLLCFGVWVTEFRSEEE